MWNDTYRLNIAKCLFLSYTTYRASREDASLKNFQIIASRSEIGWCRGTAFFVCLQITQQIIQ